MNQPSKDYREFRFRLRHDRLLRLRLRHARYRAELELARELGYAITMDDLRRPKPAKHATGRIH